MANVVKGTLKINLNKRKSRPSPGYGVTKRQATRAYVAGWMENARKHPGLYRKLGAKRIQFIFKGIKETRKI